MSTPYDWRIDAIERNANEAAGKLNEIYSLRRNVDNLEYTYRQFSSDIAELRAELQILSEEIRQLRTKEPTL